MSEGAADTHRDMRRASFVWAAAILLASAQAVLLVRGYRITADDVLFYGVGLRGWTATWEFTRTVAEGQGRIGAFIIIPMNIVAAYLSDWLMFRLLAVLLYFVTFWLFALWAQRLLVKPVAGPIFLLLVAFNVTDHLHLPPVSFPLQNTIPFLAIMGARLYLLRPVDSSPPDKKLLQRLCALVAFGAGMLSSEYGFLLGTGMLVSEYLRDAFNDGRLAAAPRLLLSRALWPSALVCLFVLAIYVGWRFGHPSTYEGNRLAPLHRLPHGLATATAHIFMPYALPYGSFFRPLAYPNGIWALVAVPVGIVAAAGFAAAGPAISRIAKPVLVASVALAVAYYVVMPASMTVSQQVACFERLGCAFLDSQIANLATAVAITALAGWFITRPTSASARRNATLGLAALAGVGAAFVFYHDKRLTDDMALFSETWETAAQAACRKDTPTDGLNEMLDPHATLEMHANFDREAFWRTFLTEKGATCLTAR